MIRLSLDATNIQREKIVFELVKPFIPGFSVEPMETDAECSEQVVSAKRKSGRNDGESTNMPDCSASTALSQSQTTTKKNKKSKK